MSSKREQKAAQPPVWTFQYFFDDVTEAPARAGVAPAVSADSDGLPLADDAALGYHRARHCDPSPGRWLIADEAVPPGEG